MSVDETMVGFRGRFSAKQYMPAKPTKYGVKAFTLAESEHGYLLNCLVYTGGDTLDSSSPEYANLPQPARIVLHLLEPCLGKGHRIFTDRYYTSIPLAIALGDKSTSFTGTAIKNRIDLPDAIRSPTFRLKDDEIKAFRADRLLALGWRARQKKKPLIVLSSAGSAMPMPVQSRATQRVAIKPFVVDDYNKSMNGVDWADQLTVYYAFVRKSRKWWRKVFFWLFEVTIVNSYILYKLSVPSPVSHFQFRQSIVNALASKHLSTAPPRARPGRPPKRCLCEDPERANSNQQHYLDKKQQRECVVCSSTCGGKRKRTMFFCAVCPSKPSLCPAPCFGKYHQNLSHRQ